MTTSLKYSSLILAILLYSSSLPGQNDQKAVLPNSEVDVIKEFDASLEDAARIQLSPKMIERDTNTRKYHYTISPFNLKIPYAGANIKPLSMPTIPQDPGWPGYVKLGSGYPLASTGTIAYNYIQGNDFSINAIIDHQARYEGDLDNQRYMQNNITLGSKYILNPNVGVGLDLIYDIHDFYMYGYDHSEFDYTAPESLRKYYSPSVGIKLFRPSISENGWLYKFDMKYSRHADNQASKERNYAGILHGSKQFKNQNQFDLEIGADFTKFVDTATQHLDNFYFNPAFTFAGPSIQFRAGANLMSSEDKYFLFPDAKLSGSLIGNQLIVEIGATGGLRKNSFSNLSKVNPYVQPKLSLLNNDLFRNYYGRIKGVYKSVVYSLEGGFNQHHNFAFYQSEATDTRYFNVLHDSLNVTYFQTQLQSRFLHDIAVDARIRYNLYSKHRIESAWHLPGLESYLTFKHHALEDRLQSYLLFKLESPVDYGVVNSEINHSAWLTDVSLGVDYYLLERLALELFLELNNTLNNKRASWENYPSFGFNLMGGIKSRF